MTIKARIALGIASLLIVIAILGGVAVWYFTEISTSVSVVADAAYERLDLAQSLGFEAALLHGDATRLAPDAAGDLEERRSRFAARLKQDAVFLFARPIKGIDQVIVAEIKNDAERISQLARPASDTAQAAEIEELLVDISRRLQGVYAQNASVIEEEVAVAVRLSNSALYSISVILGLCVAFSVFVLVWLPRYVARPIARFSESITRITDGNYETRLDLEREDEFGRLAASFNVMAAELELGSDKNRAALLESQRRLKALVDQLDDFIIGMDAERRVVFVNAGMCTYLGIEEEDVLGNYMPDLALGRPRMQQLFTPIALGPGVSIEPFAVSGPGGDVRYYQQRVTRLVQVDEGTGADYIVLLKDVTDYEQRTHEQTDYLASVSHEMKTPMAAISMSVDLLEDVRLGPLADDQRELTQTIRHNVKRLMRMIDEVLTLARDEAGASKLVLSQVEVGELMHSGLENVAPLARDKGIKVEVERPDEPYSAEADAARIESAINNLLTNAIRYSPRGGGVRMACEIVTGGVRITVSDDGPGIAAPDRERIFGRFRRGTSDGTEGTGLGLAISRESVEAHGGRLYVDAAYAPGARFVLELPRRLSQPFRAKQIERA